MTMIITKENKIKFGESMKFFVKLLQQTISEIDEAVTLSLLSFGMPFDEEYLYFDFPYDDSTGDKIDTINSLLEPESEYAGIDTDSYKFIENLQDDVNYIAYNYCENDGRIELATNIHVNLPEDIFLASQETLLKFFPIMFYSAYPEKCFDANKIDSNIDLCSNKALSTWFILIHNTNITNSANKIISNYCLVYKNQSLTGINSRLSKIAKILGDFSNYYGNKNYNIILNKSFEFSDSTLAINAEIYHHIKELHSNFIAHPIRRISDRYPEDSDLSLIKRNILRVQDFYNDYVSFLNSGHLKKKPFSIDDYFKSIDFKNFIDDLQEINNDFRIEFKIISNLDTFTYVEYFNVVVKEIILNAIKAFTRQKISPQLIIIDFNIESGKSEIKCQIASIGTKYEKSYQITRNKIGSKTFQVKPNTSERGSGLVLINKLLRKMNARIIATDDTALYYFIAAEEYDLQPAFNIIFYLPTKK